MAKFLNINPTSGSGSKTVTITAPVNDLGQRTEVITVTGGGMSRQITVTQSEGQDLFELYVWVVINENVVHYEVRSNSQQIPPSTPIRVTVTVPTQEAEAGKTITNILTQRSGEWDLGGLVMGQITACTANPMSGDGFILSIHQNQTPD